MATKVTYKSSLNIRVLSDAMFELVSPFIVQLDEDEVIVPTGFKTDFASVPRLPIVYLTLGGLGDEAAVLHDYLYSRAMYPREDCDMYFYLALRESGIGYLAAKAMYLGVRVGGAGHYGSEYTTRKADKEEAKPKGLI
jgi:hypothetical protein